jgi:hypothetical protein
MRLNNKRRMIRLSAAAARFSCHPVHMKRIAVDPRYAHLGCPKLIELGPRLKGFDEDEFDVFYDRVMGTASA